MDVLIKLQKSKCNFQLHKSMHSDLKIGPFMRRDRNFPIVLIGSGWQGCPQDPCQSLLPGAPEILHIIVRPSRQICCDSRPLVPKLGLQIDHDPLFLWRKLAPTSPSRMPCGHHHCHSSQPSIQFKSTFNIIKISHGNHKFLASDD